MRHLLSLCAALCLCPAPREGASWYLGCYRADTLELEDVLHQGRGDDGIILPTCSKFCLQKGLGVIAVWNETTCYCIDENSLAQLSGSLNTSESNGNKSNGSHVDSKIKSSLPKRTEECLKRCTDSVCLPYGDGKTSLAIYSSLGPYIHNASLSLVANRVQTGKAFMLELSGYLACPLERMLGIQNLTSENFSTVKLVIRWSGESMSSHMTEVQLNGYFTLSLKWIYTEPGNHLILVHAKNMISKEECSITVEVLLPAPHSLEVKVDTTEEKIPSCVPFEMDMVMPQERLFLGEHYDFIAYVSMGIDLEFQWYFSDDNSTHYISSLYSDGLTSTMNHTFKREGLYQVCVNVSNQYDWIQQTLNVAVVQKTLFDLSVECENGYIAVGQNLTLEMKFFTTVQQLLLFNMSFGPGMMRVHRLRDGSAAFEAPDSPWLTESYRLQKCQLRFLAFHQYRAMGNYSLSVIIAYESYMLNVSLPQLVQVYEPITEIFPTFPWKKIIQAGTDASFAVSSWGDKMGSHCQWNITKSGTLVLSKSSSQWVLTNRFKTSGHYLLSVVCFNPISSGRYSNEIEVQEAVANLSIQGPNSNCIESNATVILHVMVERGTNITLLWNFAPDTAPIVGPQLTASYMYTKPGWYSVDVMAFNNVSSAFADLQLIVQDPIGEFFLSLPDTITVNQLTAIDTTVTSGTNVSLELFLNGTLVFNTSSCLPGLSVGISYMFNKTGEVEVLARAGNCVSLCTKVAKLSVVEELYVAAVEVLNQPVLGEDVIMVAKVNGLLWDKKSYVYDWTLAMNATFRSGSPLLTYRCTELGRQLIVLKVTNMASTAFAQVEINVTQHKAGPGLSHVSNGVAGEPVLFTLKNVSTISSNISLRFGDGTTKSLLISDHGSCRILHTYAAAGIYNISVLFSGSSGRILSLIVIQELLEGLTLEGPNKVSLITSQHIPSVVTWSANIWKGSNYIYQWIYCDGESNHTIPGQPKLTLEIKMPTILTILLKVENQFSHLWANMTTVAEYPILNVSLTPSRAALHQATSIEVVVEPQQEYLIMLNFGDGHRLNASSQELAPKTGCLHYALRCSVFMIQHTYPTVAHYSVSVVISNAVGSWTQIAEAVVEESVTGIQVTVITPSVIKLGDYINATVSVQLGTEVSFLWEMSSSYANYTLSGNSVSLKTQISGIYHISVSVFSPVSSIPFIQHAPKQVRVCSPLTDLRAQLPFGINYAALVLQADGSYSTLLLEFGVHVSDAADFLFDFGDGSPVVHAIQNGQIYGASAYHQYKSVGSYMIKVIAFNELYNATDELGPYYVEVAPEGLSVTLNSSTVHRDEAILFNASLSRGTNVTYTWNMGDQTTYINEGPVIIHKFSTVASHTVFVIVQNRVGSTKAWTLVSVLYRMLPVSVYTNGTVFAADTDILFVAMTAETGPLDFVWHFGDQPPQRTTSRSITKRYGIPKRYNVIVNASNQISSFTSDIATVTVQRRVVPNRLFARSSVLINSSVTFECRIYSGTNVTYLWSFGDGAVRTGKNTAHHVYSREGEFTVEVRCFNNVSSALLTKQIFVVRQPCQTPPVKHMGPLKLQVRRYQTVQLGVTFEAAILCNISQGLLYSWSLLRSDGAPVLLHPAVGNRKQTILLPSYFLEYGNYTAIARVQIVGSVVYSNYTVPLEVCTSPPVSVISGATHLFVSKSSEALISLNGSESYDPDYPGSDLRFHWKCIPASFRKQSCFSPSASSPFSMEAPVLTFPTALLDDTFDQFLFTLVVSSSGRDSSEAQVFLSVQSNPSFRSVTMICKECRGDSVNWNEGFSVDAVCVGCTGAPRIVYFWKLYLINATDTVGAEVPFCRAFDLMGPSSLFGVAFSSSTTTTTLTAVTTSTKNIDPRFTAEPISTPSNKSSILKIDSTSISSTVATTAASTATPATTVAVMELPYQVPGFLEEGSSGEKSSRSRRSSTGRLQRSFSSDPSVSGNSPEALMSGSNSSSNSSSETFRGFLPVSAVSEGDIGSSRPGPQPFSEGVSGSSGAIGRHVIGHRLSNETRGTITGGAAGGGWANEPSNSTFNHTLRDFETHYTGIQEGGSASGGRPTGQSSSSTGTFQGGGTSSGSSGDNLVDSSIFSKMPAPTLLLDWSKGPINDNIFQGYTTTGILSDKVKFKPFVLKPNKMYMLEVSVASNQSSLGKAQLYFTVNEIPQGMTCQVQPKDGFEIYTVFSIFCTSGKEDLHYEFSYQIGNSSRKTLYKGRDIQYYFNLPAGDPIHGFKVTVFTEITNRFGSKTQPCPVNVTVLPSFLRNMSSIYKLEEELQFTSLRNLSTLLLMGSHIEIRNYITLLTKVLNRLYSEYSGSAFELQSQTRNALISSVCSLSVQDQEEMIDIIAMLSDLLNITRQVTLSSGKLVTNRVREMVKLLTETGLHGKFLLDRKMLTDLVLLISSALEVSDIYSEHGIYLMLEGIRSTTDVLLRYVSLNNETQFNISTDLMEIQTSLHYGFQSTIQSLRPATFHLPDVLDKHIMARTGPRSVCYISQLVYFKKNPYFWGVPPPVQIEGDIVDLTLYNCTSRRKINVQGLVTPVTIEFEKKGDEVKKDNTTLFSLFRDKVNFHQFTIKPENQREALQITVDFSTPVTRTFPIMLLVRFSKKPTPTDFNVKRIHFWEEETSQILIPAASLKDTSSCYLALLDADYDRKPKNKYLANVVNYTVNMEWIQCLYWDDIREWKTDGCYPQEGKNSAKVSCSCTHLTTFTIASRQLSAHLEIAEVSQFLRIIENFIPCLVIMVSLALYILLVIICKLRDQHEEKKSGYILLQDNTPSDQQLYAIIIETGFRSRPKSTAKVHIVLHGEDGMSETRELYSPDKPLFERNSRHTFIMSIPDNLGPIWKVHLWHNNSGHSPSLYISYVIIKDLLVGSSWFFPAECWLAVDEGDGKVERELTSVTRGLGFRKLFYCRLTEYLEDFHFWGSVYSRPSYSWFTRTQRLTMCLVLLLGYMGMNTVLIHWKEEEYTAEHGLIDVSAVSIVTGMLTALTIFPVAAILSLLFRLSEKKMAKDAGHQGSLSAEDPSSESYSSWQNFQQWAHDAWKKKYERDSFTPTFHSRNFSERSKKGSPCSCDGSSSGFEDGSSQDNKPVQKDCKHSTNDVRSDYSSDHSSLFEQPIFHGHKVLPPWCSYLAWVFCGLIALACIAVTTLLGLRFGTTKCILWLHSLFFSIVYCIFVIEPLVILMMAAVVSWRNRDRSDFFMEALHDATKYLVCESGQPPRNFVPHSWSYSHEASTELEKILAARQRARYLRLTRPPTHAQLREAKERIRKETLIQQTLREFIMYILMLCLLLIITFGKFSDNEYFLNHAVRSEFTRNAKSPFTDITTSDHWWNWSFTALLDGLYWDTWYNRAAARAQSGPVGGKCYLIGTPFLKQLKGDISRGCTFPPQFISLTSDCVARYHPEIQEPEGINISDTEKKEAIQAEIYHWCGQMQCYKGRGVIVSLGRSRMEAYSTLLNLRRNRWLDGSTRAVAVEFALYNPPTNLFTAVSLLAEMPPSGGVIPSSFIESVRIYRIISLLDYFIMAFELAFLGLILIHLYFQLHTMIQRGLLSYWQEPWNWIEITIIGLGLSYYMCYIYHFVLRVDVIDRLQRGFFRVFIDFTFISAWEKWTRCLHGIILFLLFIKCLRLLRVHKAMAPCVAMLRLSCSSVTLTSLAGIGVMAACASLGRAVFLPNSHPFSNAVSSFWTLAYHCLGISATKSPTSFNKSNEVSMACCYGTFFLIMAFLWTGMLRGAINSLAKEAKKSLRSKHLITFQEVIAHTWEKVLSFIGRPRPKSVESNLVQSSNFYLDEFENLMDELLFRLNAFSDSLHHSLPTKNRHYTEEEEEENTLVPGSDFCCSEGSEQFPLDEGSMKLKVAKVEQELLRNNSEIIDQSLAGKPYAQESGLGSNLQMRSCLDTDEFQELSLHSKSSSPENTLNVVDEQNSSHFQSTGSIDSHLDLRTKPFIYNDRVLQVELLCETSQAKMSRSSMSESSTMSQRESSRGQCNISPTHCNLVKTGDALAHLVYGSPILEKQPAELQRLEGRQAGQSRCASASVASKSRKPLKRSQTAIIEPIATANAVRCPQSDHQSDTHRGSDTEHCLQLQRPPSEILVPSITDSNEKGEHQTEEKGNERECEEQRATKQKSKPKEKLQNAMWKSKQQIAVAPAAAELQPHNCNCQDLPGSIRQCW
ncbi:polycystic kidney disease protein 1-like 1 [Rhinatrema bivittatum]|uniref:polycystic kidney disease protein 1-like 1 n=1 Tax=Rhinatrema bivittatum TaxID=194408 RepID=UPI00112E9BF5|nr:polycystic kidney disease protein 1-like 1 [Rhinatrema bivittatum]